MISPFLGWGIDAAWGEVKRWHPLVGLGNCAQFLEARLHGPEMRSDLSSLEARARGALATSLLVGMCVFPVLVLDSWLSSAPRCFTAVFDGLMFYFCLGYRSLKEHALAVAGPLKRGELAQARLALSMIVSRDTEPLAEGDIAKGVVESVLENGNDAVVASLFWFLVAGAPGVVAHRCLNTLDAMWGYKTPRFHYFGWFAARLDDLLAWVPARICALSYAVCGQYSGAMRAWREDASLHKSPNAGAVMASGAGALGIRVGGQAPYHGAWEKRPYLGKGRDVLPGDIDRALGLLNRAWWLLFVVGILLRGMLRGWIW